MLAKTPSRVADYLEAIERLAPLIAEHRAAFDSERRLPDVVFNALADAGLFRLWLPEALGGPELSPTDFMTVVEAASALDGSVGWLVGNGGGMSRIGGYLPEPVARKFFSDPRAFVTSATGAVGTAQKVGGWLSRHRPLAVRKRRAPRVALHGPREPERRRRQGRAAAVLLFRTPRCRDPRHVAGVGPACHGELRLRSPRSLRPRAAHTHLYGASPDAGRDRLPFARRCRYSPGLFPSSRSESRAAR